MGYEACKGAYADNYQDGNFGVGTGATVGKFRGMDYCMKSGIGSYAVQIGELKVGALVAVNALGDIYDYHTGRIVAGMLNEERSGFADTAKLLYSSYEVHDNKFVGNTTIGAIITNARFDKSQLSKIAGMAHNGYARSIRPVHTSADGDSIYALSVGNIAADCDMVGTLAADVMSEAILSAVKMLSLLMAIRSAKILLLYKLKGHKQKPHHRSMAVNPVVWLLLWHYFGQKFWFNLTKYVHKNCF